MADSQRKTANLLSPTSNADIPYNASIGATVSSTVGSLPYSFNNDTITFNPSTAWTHTAFMTECISGNTYTFSCTAIGSGIRISIYAVDNDYKVARLIKNLSGEKYISETTTIGTNEKYIVVSVTATTINIIGLSKPMLNTGSTAPPYEPYGWQHSLRKLTPATDTITTLPIDLYADGTNATVGLQGNMSQTGTPSPTTPIQPQGTGERTANLFNPNQTWYATDKLLRSDGTLNDNAAFNVSDYTEVEGNTEYYLNNCNRTSTYPSICFYDENKTYLSGIQYNGATFISFTTPQNCKYIMFSVVKVDIDIVMLNTGSTALPYEPYGYKLTISSANTTTPVYLGEVQTTRKIKKLVLTGQENFDHYGAGVFWVKVEDNNAMINRYGVSNSYAFNPIIIDVPTTIANNEFCLTSANGRLWIKNTNYSNAGDFKAYLQQQYANGTPVTVWYVLATPEADTINEPLMKIGDYADSLTTSIPTIDGANSFDVLTTLKPSEVDLTYTGWHDATVKEWDGSQWD